MARVPRRITAEEFVLPDMLEDSSSCLDTDDEEGKHFALRIDPESDSDDQTDNEPRACVQTSPEVDDDVENGAPTRPTHKEQRPYRTRSTHSGTGAPLQENHHVPSPPAKRPRLCVSTLPQVATQKPCKTRTQRPIACMPTRPQGGDDPSRLPAWKTERDPDVAPPVSRFQPARPPGVQLNLADNHTPLDLFKLFVTRDAVNTLCKNTNKQAAKAQANGSKYTWTDVGVEEFYKYIGLLFYMAMAKMHTIKDYWRQNGIFSCPFPATIMSRDRYRTISWNVHMSDPDMDQENDKKQGTPQYDKLFGLRPFMDTIQDACKAFFHPRRNISVAERMVGRKANSSKLFVLRDCSTGYTVDFRLYPGKNNFEMGQGGLAYDTVMSLVNRNYLGSGYHVYMDNFYTSPKLFRDLLALNIGACGTYSDNKKDSPRIESNALNESSPGGSIRWIRDGPLVFVKWMDTKVVPWMDAKVVPVCSTIHTAFAGDTVERRVKQKGVWISKDFPCPSPIIHYNKHMGGADMTDQLIQYYTAQHKTMKWYRKMFLNLLDITVTNAYLLHKELSSLGQGVAMTRKDFQEELVAQLCGVSQEVPATRATFDHVPVPTATQTPSVNKVASVGRKKCTLCQIESGKQQCTPWKCQACDVPLCLQLTRNCFAKWHNGAHCESGTL